MRLISLQSVAIATLYSLLATSPYPTIAFTSTPQTLSSTSVPFFTKSNAVYSTTSENENATDQSNSMDIIPTENTEISDDNETDQKKSLSFDPSKCTITIIPSKYGNAFSVQQTALKSWETVATTEPFHPNSGVHRWAVRVDKSVRGHIMLGVMTSMASLNSFIGGNPFSWGAVGNQALWHRNKKIKNDYGEAFGTGSVIVLTLDTYTGTLSYGTLSNSEQLTNEEIVSALIHDVEDWGIAFEGLPLDTELFPAVSLYQRNDMVTLLGMDTMNLSSTAHTSASTSEVSNLLIASSPSVNDYVVLEREAEQKVISEKMAQVEASAEAMEEKSVLVQTSEDRINVNIQKTRGEHLFSNPSTTTSSKVTSSKSTLGVVIKTEAEKTRIKEEMETTRLTEVAVKNELIQRSLLATRLSINAADIARRTKKEVSSTTEGTQTEAKHIEEEMEKTRVEIEAKLIEEEREKARADASKEEAEKAGLMKVSAKRELSQRRLLATRLSINATERKMKASEAVTAEAEATLQRIEMEMATEMAKVAEKQVENHIGTTKVATEMDEAISATGNNLPTANKNDIDLKSKFFKVPYFLNPFSKAQQEPEVTTNKSRTQRIMEKTLLEGQTGGAGGQSSWEAFLRAEENWKKLRESKAFDYDPKLMRSDQNGVPPPFQFVTTDGAIGNQLSWAKLRDQYEASNNHDKQKERYLDFDIIVCGGTLGIFIATSLQMKGHKVCVIEGGKLQGRNQEWNISMNEMLELVELGVLTKDDLDKVIKTEFPSCRSGFKNKEATTTGSYFENGIGYECFTPDVLNLGVDPSILIEIVKKRFTRSGGVVKENTPVKGIVISEGYGAAVDVGDRELPVTARLILDCMGNGSPISRQQRYGMKPDGVCCVVGSCASGFDKKTNTLGDIIYTNSEIQDKGENGKHQYFWEAFPVNIGRGKNPGSSDTKTTYMFTYMDADEKRPSLMTLMEDYWTMLPKYQPSIKDPEKDLDVKRVLFAFFPTYRDSPLQPAFSRVLAVGDASGIQSPLSFGGFGALTRHLDRITVAISEALEADCLHKEDLALINPYTPNLSATWMFQKAMSVRMGQNVDPKFVNRLLACNFKGMDDMGIDTIKPFLQDVVRVDGLVGSLYRSFIADPTYMPVIVSHVGIPQLVDWLGHVGMMTLYTAYHAALTPVIAPVIDRLGNSKTKYQWHRKMDAWKFGSGSDYILPRDEKAKE